MSRIITDKEKEQKRNWYLKNKDRILAEMKEQYYNNKDEILAKRKEYYWSNQEKVCKRVRQYYQDNIDAVLEYNRERNKDPVRKEYVKVKGKKHYEEHKDEYIQRAKIWNRNHPENAYNRCRRRLARINNVVGGHYTKQEFDLLCAQHGNKCLRCGKEGPLTADHVIPISFGVPHSDEIENIQPLCQSCNSSKSTKVIDYRNGDVGVANNLYCWMGGRFISPPEGKEKKCHKLQKRLMAHAALFV